MTPAEALLNTTLTVGCGYDFFGRNKKFNAPGEFFASLPESLREKLSQATSEDHFKIRHEDLVLLVQESEVRCAVQNNRLSKSDIKHYCLEFDKKLGLRDPKLP